MKGYMSAKDISMLPLGTLFLGKGFTFNQYNKHCCMLDISVEDGKFFEHLTGYRLPTDGDNIVRSFKL